MDRTLLTNARLITMDDENIESVMVGGQWLMWEKEILSVDEGAILDEARRRAADIVQRAGIQLPPRFKIVD